MIENREILNIVKNKYLDLQTKRELLIQDAENSLLEHDDYYKVSTQLSSLIIDKQKAEFLENDNQIKELSTKIKELTKTKSSLQKKYKKAQNTPYLCNICDDTGFVDNKICKCYIHTITSTAYNILGITEPTLNSFSDDKYSSQIGLKQRYVNLTKYAKTFNNDKNNIIFLGEPGTGKTFLAKAIVNEIQDNFNPIFLSAFDFDNIFINNMYADESHKKTIMDILTTCDLLVIDDLGTERIINKITKERLLEVITLRQTNNKPFIITTNLSLTELSNRYEERIFSRISSKKTLMIKFNGQDLRRL